MQETIDRLKQLLYSGREAISLTDEATLLHRPQPGKWSKKEILGHLIDSAVNNLLRFTEIQFERKPFTIKSYKQEGLVEANHYQNSQTLELLNLWTALNQRICFIMQQQTEASLQFEIILPDGSTSDLSFLIIDYVDHLEHHVNQLKN